MHYLSAIMMRRHLLTLFALFSGFAALHAPASASSLETMVFDARAFARANDTLASENCICPVRAQQRSIRCRAREKQQPQRRLPAALRPPIVFGSERALE
ncbi:hypothetical protein [Qipengyuania sp. ASV99]|uniref:hypothetical protein n=1 Tax=Qipengyuania sp. ASV99 TaxID=3399681 RepID=UPI003A4C507D